MTQKEFYQKKFLPAFHTWEVYMRRSGRRAYDESYNICAMKELHKEMQRLSSDETTASLEFMCNDGNKFIDMYFDFLDNHKYSWTVFADGDLRAETFEDFFAGILIRNT